MEKRTVCVIPPIPPGPQYAPVALDADDRLRLDDDGTTQSLRTPIDVRV
jgi:hypothetical protein